VSVDSLRVQQIVTNAVSNSIKSTSEGEIVIKLSVHSPERGIDLIRIDIVDTGHGLRGADPVALFEPFVSAFSKTNSSASTSAAGKDVSDDVPDDEGADHESTTNTTVRSTGLGLPISRSIARRMGGDVSLTEDADANTTTFTFLFPLVKATVVSPQAGAKSLLGPLLPPGLTILVVDDDLINRRVTRRRLAKVGVETYVASDGDEIGAYLVASSQLDAGLAKANGVKLEPAKEHCMPFDAIVTDMRMDRVGGIEACEVMRRLGVTVPFIGMTGNTSRADMARYEAVGFTRVLSKPHSEAELIQAIRASLPARSAGSAKSSLLAPRRLVHPPSSPF